MTGQYRSRCLPVRTGPRMRPRPLAGLALVGLAILVVGCAATHEFLTGRDIECSGVDEAECLRIAEVGLRAIEPTLADPAMGDIRTIVVSSADCLYFDIDAALACWEVEVATANGGAGSVVHRRRDGTLVAG